MTPLSTSRSVPGGMPTAAKAFAAVDHRARVGERAGAGHDADRAARVERLDDPTAKLALVGVDDRDRQLAQDLVEIGLWVIDAVDQRRADQQDERAADREHALPFAGEGAGDTGPIGGQHHIVCRRPAAQASRDRAQPQQREQRVERGECRERGKREGRIWTPAGRAPPCPNSTAMYQRKGRIALQA